ncbi:hypothetical protein WG906_02715 [Pedobacter sp. P351]|uniref:hypothetical protein n=1 Tax=Pedobacter superstes TaxID=3133441 RepID=UPI0030A27434
MKIYIAVFLGVFLAGCSTKEDSRNMPGKYFDIRGYFEKEAKRLQKQNPVIEKIVSQNIDFEKKHVRVADWKTELELFAESDINKPAWKSSYLVKTNGPDREYLSSDNNLRTKKITIRFSENGAVKKILIFNKTSNALYTSTEELTYFPDSLYIIKKRQNVLVIGKNEYSISSIFKNQ